MGRPLWRGVTWLASLALLFATAGCQTTGLDPTGLLAGGQVEQAPEDAAYGLLFTPADHIDALLERGQLDAASAVYAYAADYLEGRDNNRYRRAPGDSADRLEIALKAALFSETHDAWGRLQAMSWPAPPADWQAMRETLADAEVVLEDVAGHEILKAPGREIVFAGRLEAEAAAWRTRLAEQARPTFAGYDLSGAGNFFADYPILLDGRAFLAANQDLLIAGLEGRDAATIARVYQTYAHHLPDGLKAQVARRHYEAVLQARGGEGALASLEALAATRAAGMPDGDWRARSIAVFDVSLTAPARGGNPAFPVEVNAPAPIEVRRMTLRDSLLTADAREAPYLVYLDVLETRVSREIVGRETVASQYRSGIRSEPNPAYMSLQESLDQAESNAALFTGGTPSLGTSCQSWDCVGIEAALMLGSVLAETFARRKVETLRAELSDTPMNFDEPEYDNYSFVKLSVALRRHTKVRLHVLDRLHHRYGTMTATLAEGMTFEIADGMHDEDRYRYRTDRQFDSDADIAAFAAQPFELSMARFMLRSADLKLVDVDTPDLETVAAAIEHGRDQAGITTVAVTADPPDRQRRGRATVNRRKR